MSAISVRSSSRAPTVVAPNRIFSFTPSGPMFISIGRGGGGDATTDHRSALLQAGITYEFQTSPPDVILDALTSDRRADTTPFTLTYLDAGPRPT